eukprot:jgi/Ulvmu1/973/UM102_0057.1
MCSMGYSTAVFAVTALGLVNQVAAYPSLYNSMFALCEIPDKGYDGHMPPMANDAITFDLTDATGESVTAWEAGAVYTLTVAPYDTASPTNAWVHASVGTLAPVNATSHESAAACDAAVFSTGPIAGPHVVTWTAPANDSTCVTVSTAQATGPSAGYDVGLVSLPGAAAAAPCTPPVLVVSDEAPDTHEGEDEGEDHDHEDEGHTGEAPAAEEGLAEADGAASSAAWATAAAAACVGAMAWL